MALPAGRNVVPLSEHPRAKARSAKPELPDSRAPAPDDVFATLAQILLPDDGPAAGGGDGVAACPPSFMTELTRMQREGGGAMSSDDEVPVNVVRGIKSAPNSAGLGTVDDMAIDIVAMLFDYVFADPNIPARVKVLLGRLQIPALKAALLDKSFFSSRAHPARRLIDLLAESALGLDDASARANPALELIEEIVDQVLVEFDTDLAPFETLGARAAEFIEQRKQAELDVVERSARWVEDRQREEAAHAAAEDEVARRLDARAWVTPPLRDMLENTWTRALARTEGEASPAWLSLVATMEELLWSVEPKVAAEDRKRLVTMLPAMLARVQDGMVRGELAEVERNAFLGTLVDCHALAVKAGLRGMAALPQQGVAPPRAEEVAIERATVPAGDIQVEEIRLRMPKGAAAARKAFMRTSAWSSPQRGTWVEFARPGGPSTRARLAWISPNKGVYLFTNPASPAAAISISPEALAEQMRLAEARVIDDAPLVERAMRSMLAALRQRVAEGGPR